MVSSPRGKAPVSGEERFEDALLDLVRHAHPGIAHRKQDVLAGGDARVQLRVIVVEGLPRGRELELATVGHGVTGVHREIGQHLFNLAAIRQHHDGMRRERRRQLDVLADQPPQHFADVGDHLVQVKHHGLDQLAPGESQELASQSGGTLTRLPNFLQAGQNGRRRRGIGNDQLGLAHDHGEQIVEVVRHPARQPPDRLHLLRLHCLLLDAPQFGDVFRHADDPV